MIINCLDNLQTSDSVEKSGIMTLSPIRGYRILFQLFDLSASSMEHLFKGSFALFAITVYDHTLVEDF